MKKKLYMNNMDLILQRFASRHFKITKDCRFASTLPKGGPTPEGNSNGELHPFFITGFADGESNFTVIITKSKSLKVG